MPTYIREQISIMRGIILDMVRIYRPTYYEARDRSQAASSSADDPSLPKYILGALDCVKKSVPAGHEPDFGAAIELFDTNCRFSGEDSGRGDLRKERKTLQRWWHEDNQRIRATSSKISEVLHAN